MNYSNARNYNIILCSFANSSFRPKASSAGTSRVGRLIGKRSEWESGVDSTPGTESFNKHADNQKLGHGGGGKGIHEPELENGKEDY